MSMGSLRPLCLCLLLLGANAATSQAQDNTLYADLLARHVHGGLVDYDGLKADEATLDRYLDTLAAVDPAALPRDAAFAYFLNVYNAWTLKLILQHWPGVASIKDLGTLWRSPWRLEFVRLKQGLTTLDQVEHGMLRPQFKDPRLHFAVNCASMGCPRLHNAPFEGPTLNATLDGLARATLNDPAFTACSHGMLTVSRVFDWFKEDWGGDGDIIAFVLRHADPPLAECIREAGGRPAIRFMPWDWQLNRAQQ